MHTTTFPHEVCTVTPQTNPVRRVRADSISSGRYIQDTQVCLLCLCSQTYAYIDAGYFLLVEGTGMEAGVHVRDPDAFAP